MRGSSKDSKTKAAKPDKPAKSGRNSRSGAVLSLLGAFVATSVALGLLVAGLAVPAAGLFGSSTKSGIKLFQGIPGEFSDNALSQQAKILAADGSVIATPSDDSRIVVPSNQIPKVMKDAQVAIEDERFYQHGALDQRGLARAVAANLFSSNTQGASTLTQQYVKVAEQRKALASGNQKEALDAVSQSGTKAYVRKLRQLKYAVDLERTHTKDQILTSYLNVVYFGDQQYGIEAASLHYFGHPAKDLTLAEAATLAGTVNLPTATNPIKNPEAAKKRRDIVLQKMAQQGMVTQAQADAAIAQPIKTKPAPVVVGCASSKYPYYCEYVMNYLATLPELGKTPKERLGNVRNSGMVIQTALDPKKMEAMNKELTKRVPVANSADVQAASVLIQPGTGLVMAMAQNTKYDVAGTDQFNTTLNYADSGFPIGSTAKLFAIVEAMRQGRSMDSTINVPKMNGTDGAGPYRSFNSKSFPGPCGQKKGEWRVHNDHQVPAGPMSLSKATGESVNTAFAQLTADLGACKVRDAYKLMGVTSTAHGDINADPSAIVLGADSSTPMMMANAFATIAADGKYCAPRPIVGIKSADGKPMKVNFPACKQVLSVDQARGVEKIFTAPFASDGTAATAKLNDGREAFGKTGTVDDSKHTWFVGATRQLSTAIWVGRAGRDAQPIRNVTIGGKGISGFLYGGDIAAPAWKTMMDSFSQGMPKQALPDPSKKVKEGEQVAIPDLKGKSESDARSQLEKLKFEVVVKKQATGEKVSSGQVYKTEPGANSKAGKGEKVTIYVKP